MVPTVRPRSENTKAWRINELGLWNWLSLVGPDQNNGWDGVDHDDNTQTAAPKVGLADSRPFDLGVDGEQ